MILLKLEANVIRSVITMAKGVPIGSNANRIFSHRSVEAAPFSTASLLRNKRKFLYERGHFVDVELK